MIASALRRADERGRGSRQAEETPAVATSWLKRNAAILGVLAACAATLIAWSVVVPAWESADEPTHWQYANYVHDHSALPPYQVLPLAAYEPPLYYALISPQR
jgi:hypothetical protein